MRREFAEYFKEETAIVSTDNMNKIRYGAPAVSRYHQIRKIYMENDAPQLSDHDFPDLYKTIPCGLMILSNDFEHQDIPIKDHHLLRDKKQDDLDDCERSDTDHIEKLKMHLYRAALELDAACTKEGITDFVLKSLSTDQPVKGNDTVLASEEVDVILNIIGEEYGVKFIVYDSINSVPTLYGKASSVANKIISLGYNTKSKELFRTKSLNEKLESIGEYEA